MISIRPAPHSFPAGDWPTLLGCQLQAGPEGAWGEAEPAGQWAGTRGERVGAAHQPSPSAKGRGRGGASRRALEAGDPGWTGEASQPEAVTPLRPAPPPPPPPRAVQYPPEVGQRVLERGGGAEPGASRENRHRPQESARARIPLQGRRRAAGGTRRRARTMQSCEQTLAAMGENKCPWTLD